jgi:hypothetical protein
MKKNKNIKDNLDLDDNYFLKNIVKITVKDEESLLNIYDHKEIDENEKNEYLKQLKKNKKVILKPFRLLQNDETDQLYLDKYEYETIFSKYDENDFINLLQFLICYYYSDTDDFNKFNVVKENIQKLIDIFRYNNKKKEILDPKVKIEKEDIKNLYDITSDYLKKNCVSKIKNSKPIKTNFLETLETLISLNIQPNETVLRNFHFLNEIKYDTEIDMCSLCNQLNECFINNSKDIFNMDENNYEKWRDDIIYYTCLSFRDKLNLLTPIDLIFILLTILDIAKNHKKIVKPKQLKVIEIDGNKKQSKKNFKKKSPQKSKKKLKKSKKKTKAKSSRRKKIL